MEVVHDCPIVSPLTKLWITTCRLDVLLQVSKMWRHLKDIWKIFERYLNDLREILVKSRASQQSEKMNVMRKVSSDPDENF